MIKAERVKKEYHYFNYMNSEQHLKFYELDKMTVDYMTQF